MDVGKGTIVKPKDRLFHRRQMPDNALRVSVASVKAGYEGFPRPIQTDGEDDETPTQLGQCKNWPILWPKNLLRVEVAGSTPTGPQEGMTTTPPTQVQPSSVLLAEIERHEEGGPTVPPADDAICPMEEDRDHDMEEADDDPNQYFNTAFDNEVTMSQPYEYEMHVPEPERPRECKKSLFMQSSQDTPPDAGSTQAQLISQSRPMLSPTTLGVVLREGLTDPPAPQPTKKKQRKRPAARKSNKAGNVGSSSQPPSTKVDHVPMKHAPLIHVAGEPMVPANALAAIEGDLRRLHDHVLSTERSLLASDDPGYPLYTVHVPSSCKMYVHTCPADLFFLRFDYIFQMFQMRTLDFTFVRLYALHMNYIVRREQVTGLAVADPYYMHEGFLSINDANRQYASQYIEEFLVSNKDKETILLPYHPR